MYYVHSAFIRNSTQLLSNCRKKREEIGFLLKTKKYETILNVVVPLSWCALESEFWPLVELLAKEEIHSHFSLIIMQFSHRTFENFSSLSCTARDSSSYLVA